MALTAAQRSEIRFFCGWPGRYYQTDSALERAMNALSGDSTTEAIVINPITGSPPGLLALCRNVLVQISNATKRLKALKVGSIELNSQEMEQLRDLGRMYSGQLCALLGVPRLHDVFGSSGSHAGNYIGK